MPDNKKDIGEDIRPNEGETPSQYADRLGLYYTTKVTDEHKKDFGQFFTPLGIAQFMANFCATEMETVRILDPGCGIGILTASIAEALLVKNAQLRRIELVAFETDSDILPLAENCFTFLSSWLSERGVNFTFFLCKNDFILHNSAILNNENNVFEAYDIVISNPPYFKLAKDDARAVVAKSVIHGQSNIYTIFLLIATKLLRNNGQLIFITPRSFCSGNYFRLFRELFFSIVDLKTVHLFNSRKEAFKRDKVLQENIIISATRKELEYANAGKMQVTISTSNGTKDIDNGRSKQYSFSDLTNLASYQKILHLPVSDTDEEVIEIFKSWTGSLSAYDLKISTGPVVDFRSVEMIRLKNAKNTVPLIWLHNIDAMSFKWPLSNGYKGKTKGQYIVNNEKSLSRLIENKNYVFLRRFSSKDDNRRLIASPYLRDVSNTPMLGVENHLNYIYHKRRELTDNEAVGLSTLLNSKLFDLYFRTFNGNINVSATELRDFPLPDFKLIKSLGQRILQLHGAKADIDLMVSEIFNLQIDLSENYG